MRYQPYTDIIKSALNISFTFYWEAEVILREKIG
jgi:hypothetical protein